MLMRMYDKGHLIHCCWSCKMVRTLWKSLRITKKLKLDLPYNPLISLFGISLKVLTPYVQIRMRVCSLLSCSQQRGRGNNFTFFKRWMGKERSAGRPQQRSTQLRTSNQGISRWTDGTSQGGNPDPKRQTPCVLAVPSSKCSGVSEDVTGSNHRNQQREKASWHVGGKR